MTSRTVDPRAHADLEADLGADGLGDLVAELRGYAELAPAPRPALTSRVLVALRDEAAVRREVAASPGGGSLLGRFGFGLRPASFRSVLAAAALVAALGAGAVFAANGGLPFALPDFAPRVNGPADPTEQVTPGNATTGEDADETQDSDADADESPQSSEDADAEEDQDEDASNEDEDEDSDADEDDDDQGANGDNDDQGGNEDNDDQGAGDNDHDGGGSDGDEDADDGDDDGGGSNDDQGGDDDDGQGGQDSASRGGNQQD